MTHRERADGTVRVAALLRVLSEHDPPTYLHSLRVAHLCREIGNAMDLSESALQELEHGALLHDIGKIAISQTLLQKADPLTAQEYSAMQQHVLYGYWLLRDARGLERTANVVLASHEWVNGAGYPHGAAGDAIPLGSRIVAVADAFDVMTQRTHYRFPRSAEDALRELERYAGTQFDRAVVAALEIALMIRELESQRLTSPAPDAIDGSKQ